MVRFGRYKYVHYEGYRPQLFDLENDPLETRDLALEPGHETITAEGEKRLRAICDPTEVSERAFRDQEHRIAELGGAEAVLNAWQLSVYTGAGRGAPLLLSAVPAASSSTRRTTEILRAVSLLLGHTKLESTVRSLGSRSTTHWRSWSRRRSKRSWPGSCDCRVDGRCATGHFRSSRAARKDPLEPADQPLFSDSIRSN